MQSPDGVLGLAPKARTPVAAAEVPSHTPCDPPRVVPLAQVVEYPWFATREPMKQMGLLGDPNVEPVVQSFIGDTQRTQVGCAPVVHLSPLGGVRRRTGPKFEPRVVMVEGGGGCQW
jgi:hypothetical protein